MEYLINGSVIVMLLLFFAILSSEATTIKVFNQKKSIADIFFHFRVAWRQKVASRK